MKYVYLLQSELNSEKRYIGSTDNLNRRLMEHNAGKSPYTAPWKPWRLIVAIRFEDDCKALAFERYLKVGSGFAFAHRHFW